MKNILIPAGEVLFLGSYEELANEMYSLRGKIEDNGEYRCRVAVPKRKRNDGISLGAGTRPVRVTFLFCGNISSYKEGYKITYKVYPNFLLSLLYLCAMLYMLVQVFLGWTGGWQQLAAGLAAYGFVCLIVLGVLVLVRHFAIRQFVKRFQDDWESGEGIF